MFVDYHVVLGDYSDDWIVEQFFWETIGLSYDSISEVIINTWAGPAMLSLQEMESHVVEVLLVILELWISADCLYVTGRHRLHQIILVQPAPKTTPPDEVDIRLAAFTRCVCKPNCPS